jgi:flagellar biosynthesis protein FlhG
MADLGAAHRARLLHQLSALDRVADVIIIDCAAGISENVLAFACAAHTTLVTTTTEPTALTDAYGMVKSLLRREPQASVQLVVNMSHDAAEARGVHERMNRVTSAFLGRRIDFAGWIPPDPAVGEAVRCRLPFVLHAPQSPATRAIEGLARRLLGVDLRGEGGSGGGFFSRLASWFTGTSTEEHSRGKLDSG